MADEAANESTGSNAPGGPVQASSSSVCRACGQPIPPGASKCARCGSYQDWRRFALGWPGAAVAILGIVPAAGIALAHFKPFFPAAVHVQLTACDQHLIVVETRNSGGRTATLGRPIFGKFSGGAWHRIGMTGLWEDDPFTPDAAHAEPGEAEPDEQRYPNDISVFFRREIDGQCKIGVLVPILIRSRPERYSGALCNCVYQD